jgi:hypothetical protein
LDGLHFFLPAPVPQAKLPTAKAKAKAKALCAELTHYSLLSLLITEHAPDMPVVFFWGFKRASYINNRQQAAGVRLVRLEARSSKWVPGAQHSVQ